MINITKYIIIINITKIYINIIIQIIAWKVSKYGVISGPYSIRIQENTEQK